jgi:hypothetical protein
MGALIEEHRHAADDIAQLRDFICWPRSAALHVDPALPSSPMTATSSPQVAMVAGETSGDLLCWPAAGWLAAPKWPDLHATALAAPHDAASAALMLGGSERLAVHGYSLEVILEAARYPEDSQAAARASCCEIAQRCFIGVDAPDFNLGLEASCVRKASKPCTLSAPRSGPGAPERVEKIRAAARPRAVHVSRSSRHCWPSTALRRLLSVTPWPR